MRQLKQAEEARRSMTKQLAAAAAEAALVKALQIRQVEPSTVLSRISRDRAT